MEDAVQFLGQRAHLCEQYACGFAAFGSMCKSIHALQEDWWQQPPVEQQFDCDLASVKAYVLAQQELHQQGMQWLAKVAQQVLPHWHTVCECCGIPQPEPDSDFMILNPTCNSLDDFVALLEQHERRIEHLRRAAAILCTLRDACTSIQVKVVNFSPRGDSRPAAPLTASGYNGAVRYMQRLSQDCEVGQRHVADMVRCVVPLMNELQGLCQKLDVTVLLKRK